MLCLTILLKRKYLKMFNNMKQFLSSDVCLSCEGCCRFDKEKSDWRPKVGKSEEPPIVENLSDKQNAELKPHLFEKGGYIQDKLCHGLFTCVFFNSEDTTCGIYQNRPFECRLYPFVLTLKNNKPVVCVHLTCPYIQTEKDSPKYHEYVSYLKNLFQEEKTQSLLVTNPHLFGKYLGYENELEWVFDVDLESVV